LSKFGQKWGKFGQNLDKFGGNLGRIDQDLGKFNQIWAKSKSCIPKNIRSPTAMPQPAMNR